VPDEMWPATLEVSVERRDGSARVRLTGELDLATLPCAQSALDDALASGARRIVIDLSGLELLDISGMRALLDAIDRARAQGRSAALVAPSGAARRLLGWASGRTDPSR
jgi:anti-sigma B factor antagonist